MMITSQIKTELKCRKLIRLHKKYTNVHLYINISTLISAIPMIT